MGQQAAQPYLTIAAILRGSQASETNSDAPVFTGQDTSGHETELADGIAHNSVQGKKLLLKCHGCLLLELFSTPFKGGLSNTVT